MDNFKVGDRILFGKFPLQQKKSEANIKPQPILWRIMHIRSNKKRNQNWTKKILLLSEYGIIEKPYNDDPVIQKITWKTSSLKKWLNTDFFNESFTDEEKKYIDPITQSIWKRILSFRNNSYITEDRVFIFSLDDVMHYFSANCVTVPKPIYDISGNKRGEFNFPSQELKSRGNPETVCYMNGEKDFWWLRNTVYRNEYAMYIGIDGLAYPEGRLLNGIPGLCVRPAMWIKL